MIQSMTGYGKTVVAYKGKKINVEVKSLNSKQLDLTTRIAPLYREKEMEVRQIVAEKLMRGKLELAVWIEKDAATEATPVNTALMDSYYQQLKVFADEHAIAGIDWMQTLTRMPDVLTKTEVEVLDDEEWKVVRQGVCEAVQNLVDFRTQEGAALEKKFAEKIDNIEQLLASIEPYEKSRVEKIRQRIVDGLKQIPGAEYDKNRLEPFCQIVQIINDSQRIFSVRRGCLRGTVPDAAGFRAGSVVFCEKYVKFNRKLCQFSQVQFYCHCGIMDVYKFE